MNIDEFPPEILLRIFSFFSDKKDLYNLTRLSKKFNLYANDCSLEQLTWKNIVNKELGISPKMGINETYKQFYLRIHNQFLKPLAALGPMEKFLEFGPYQSKCSLYVAIQLGLDVIVADLLKKKFLTVEQINQAIDYCWPHLPLLFAANEGYANIVKLLLDHGAKIDVPDSDRRKNTALHLASQHSEETVKLLLDKEANLYALNEDGQTPLHLAAQRADKVVVELLLMQDKNKASYQPDTKGNTPLALALDPEVIELFLKHGANKEELQNNKTILHDFIKFKIHMSLESLIKKLEQLDINIQELVNQTDENDNTPLHLAYEFFASEESGLSNINDLLKSGANVDKLNKFAQTPLLAIVRNTYFANKAIRSPLIFSKKNNLLKIFLDHGARKTIEQTDNSGNTLLHFITVHPEATRLLLTTVNGSMLYHTNQQGDTPLHVAASFKNPSIIEGIKLLLNAAEVENKKIMEIFHTQYMHIKNALGQTPLHVAACFGHVEVVKFLIENGAKSDIHTPDNNGHMPLHLAMMNITFYSDISLVECLLKNDAKINQTDKDGNTPLHILTRNSTYYNPEILQLLCKQGADIHIPNNQGQTPLHIASMNDFPEPVKILLENGAITQMDLPDHAGKTPITLAQECHHTPHQKLFIAAQQKLIDKMEQELAKSQLIIEASQEEEETSSSYCRIS